MSPILTGLGPLAGLKDTCVVLNPPEEPHSTLSEVSLCAKSVAGLFECLYVLIQESFDLINCVLVGARWHG